MTINPDNIPYRMIYSRLDPVRAMMLKRGYAVGIYFGSVRWEVWRKDRNWYVGRINP
jgi:hypothetical protein